MRSYKNRLQIKYYFIISKLLTQFTFEFSFCFELFHFHSYSVTLGLVLVKQGDLVQMGPVI